jgi:hypothetical protein
LFNILKEDVIDYIGGGSAYAPVVEGMSFPGLLFADNFLSVHFQLMAYRKGLMKW